MLVKGVGIDQQYHAPIAVQEAVKHVSLKIVTKKIGIDRYISEHIHDRKVSIGTLTYLSSDQFHIVPTSPNILA